MRSLLLSFVLLCAITSGVAGEKKYPVSDIPENLMKNAWYVYREDIGIFKIYAMNRATFSVRQVITILDPKGKGMATEVIGYSKLSKVRDINAVVYDAGGNVIKKLKNSEIYDQSAFDGVSLYSDNRLKAIDLQQAVYPYTVELEYELEHKYIFAIPSFSIGGSHASVQRASFELQYADGLAPRYKEHHVKEKPQTGKTADGLNFIRWTFLNVEPLKTEPFTPFEDQPVPYISAAPSAFDFDGYKGTMNSWNEFGQWIASLNKGRNVIPDATKQKVQELTAPLKTTEEKVKAVYEYLQGKTRYVSVQLGIGGFQPFEAAVVDQYGYGDCKALSNYMVSMLDAIGIKSNYVLIRAGRGEDYMDVDFPSTQFNHAIAAVPNGKDTIWLECTSQTNPFGYQGSFTGDRKALMITENGAKVVNTTKYNENHNTLIRTVDVTLAENGDATAKASSLYSGLLYEYDGLQFTLDNTDDQRKWIEENTKIPSFNIASFNIKNHKNKIPTAEVNVALELRRYASVSGKRIFLQPNLMSKNTFIPEKVDERKTKVEWDNAFTSVDTVKYKIPESIYPEFLPQPVKYSSRFGEYECDYKMDAGSLVYTRKLRMKKGIHPPEAYSELIEFMRNVSKADNTKVVFMSKT